MIARAVLYPGSAGNKRWIGESINSGPPPRRPQRGLSMSTSFAVIMPVLLLVIFGVIEAGIWWHGRHVAQQAADTASDIARSRDTDLGRARHAARHVADVGGLQRVRVSVHRGQRHVTATATGRVPMPIDLGWGTISQTATAPAERITRP
jgi:hypothetical protein